MNGLQTLNLLLLWGSILTACVSSNQEQSPKQSQTGIIEIDNFKINYIRRGQGEPLVVIGSSQYYARAFAKALEEKYEFIYVDARHFAASCPDQSNTSQPIIFQTFSQDLEKIRQELKLEKITLLGHSVHGQIALDYALNYPENVSKLIIVAGVPYHMSELNHLREEIWNAEASEERKKTFANNQVLAQKILDTTAADKSFEVAYFYEAPLYWVDPHYDASFLLNNVRTCPTVFEKLFSLIPGKEEVMTKINALSVPSLVILGKLDFVIPYTAWQEVLKGKSNPEYVLMEDASHNPQTENITQKDFNRILSTWLDKGSK